MLVGVQETLTDVIVGDAVVVLPPPPLLPPQPATYNEPMRERASRVLHVIHASARQIVREVGSAQL
jgi:hypothetical protein